jgi:hypothetical protein
LRHVRNERWVIGEKQTLGEYIYNDFTINIDGTEYYIDGVDLDENRIATAIRVYSLLGEDENEYYLKRSEDYFDGALNQDIYSGTYSIKDLNATINLKYDKESELFSYDIFAADRIDSGRSLFMPAVYEKISVL